MGFFHHGTIKKYTAALLKTFSDLEVQYNTTNGILTKSVPVTYSSKEKSSILSKLDEEQILSGNYNFLPRASLALSGLGRASDRQKNKNMKINTVKKPESFDFLYNSVPYDFNYDLVIMCRGMQEATIFIEQICTIFNPGYYIDIYDATNLDEPSRIPVLLNDVNVQNEDYEEFSSNIFTLTFSFTVKGNLYPPIKTYERIKEFKMHINETADMLTYKPATLMNWDVDEEGKLYNEQISHIPVIIDIISDNLSIGENAIFAIYDYRKIVSSDDSAEILQKDVTNLTGETTISGDLAEVVQIEEINSNKSDGLTFDWKVLVGDATISADLNEGTLTVLSAGEIEIQLTISDDYGNKTSLSKLFTIL